MRCSVALLAMTIVALLLCLDTVSSSADVTDLSNGVLITHHPPGMQFTNPPPEEGWCQYYINNFEIACCEEQNPRIDSEDGAVWYVLAAWDEEKEFCGVDFGFGDCDGNIFSFVDWGPCCESEFMLEIPTENWPGPNEGTAVFCPDWAGNYLPIYCFVGYAYAPGVIPLGVDPATGDAAVGNCVMPSQVFDFTCLGGMGILTDGVECCPAGGPSPAEESTWGAIKQLYR